MLLAHTQDSIPNRFRNMRDSGITVSSSATSEEGDTSFWIPSLDYGGSTETLVNSKSYVVSRIKSSASIRSEVCSIYGNEGERYVDREKPLPALPPSHRKKEHLDYHRSSVYSTTDTKLGGEYVRVHSATVPVPSRVADAYEPRKYRTMPDTAGDPVDYPFKVRCSSCQCFEQSSGTDELVLSDRRQGVRKHRRRLAGGDHSKGGMGSKPSLCEVWGMF